MSQATTTDFFSIFYLSFFVDSLWSLEYGNENLNASIKKRTAT